MIYSSKDQAKDFQQDSDPTVDELNLSLGVSYQVHLSRWASYSTQRISGLLGRKDAK